MFQGTAAVGQTQAFASPPSLPLLLRENQNLLQVVGYVSAKGTGIPYNRPAHRPRHIHSPLQACQASLDGGGGNCFDLRP